MDTLARFLGLDSKQKVEDTISREIERAKQAHPRNGYTVEKLEELGELTRKQS